MNRKPLPVTTAQIRAGRYDVQAFVPTLIEIPSEFAQSQCAWSVVASSLLWRGSGAATEVVMKPGLDRDMALLHVGAVLLAIDLPVEHREAAAAYLLWLWCEYIATPDGAAGRPPASGCRLPAWRGSAVPPPRAEQGTWDAAQGGAQCGGAAEA